MMMSLDDFGVERVAQHFGGFFCKHLQQIDAEGEVARLKNGDLLRGAPDARFVRFRVTGKNHGPGDYSHIVLTSLEVFGTISSP